jgi:release factor glutamine methyltransferase
MKKPETGDKRLWTILKLLNWATDYFNQHDIENPKATAEILLAESLHFRRIDLYLQHDRPLHRQELSNFKMLLKRKLKREPVAYIVGNREFWSLPLAVTRDVLIPRPETERLVEAALQIIDAASGEKKIRVLELGTGSGALILALASQKGDHVYYASDISEKALTVAKQNADTLGLNAIRFFAGDWMAPLSLRKSRFDMVISNPPYIPSRQLETLSPEIRHYEPRLALDGDEDGLKCLRHIVQNGWQFLKAGGWLLLEMGYDQKNEVVKIVSSCGKYDEIMVMKDYGGHDRVIKLRKTAWA